MNKTKYEPLPIKEVVIMGTINTVEYREINWINSDNMGKSSVADAALCISSTMPYDLQMQTLLHEITHTLLHHMGYADYASNEQLVAAFSQGLFSVFMATPSLSEILNQIVRNPKSPAFVTPF